MPKTITDKAGNVWDLISVDEKNETATYRANFAWPDYADISFSWGDLT